MEGNDGAGARGRNMRRVRKHRGWHQVIEGQTQDLELGLVDIREPITVFSWEGVTWPDQLPKGDKQVRDRLEAERLVWKLWQSPKWASMKGEEGKRTQMGDVVVEEWT